MQQRVKSPRVFSEMISEGRKAKGWSQGDLAKRLGVSRGTISEIESGKIENVAIGTVMRALYAVDMRLTVAERHQPDAYEIQQMAIDRKQQKMS